MCLLVNPHTKVETAEEDLVFYKLAWKILNPDGFKYYSYFRNADIELGKTYSDNDTLFRVYPSLPGGYQGVFEGAYHLFVNEEDVRDYSDRDKDVILKAVVPKGTRFMRGDFGTRGRAYPCVATKSVRYELL